MIRQSHANLPAAGWHGAFGSRHTSQGGTLQQTGRISQRKRGIQLVRHVFVRNWIVLVAAIPASLAIGVAGYHYFVGLSWIDAFLNASMILTGMGQISPLETSAGKIFASFYALYSGVVFLAVWTSFLADSLHHVLPMPDAKESK